MAVQEIAPQIASVEEAIERIYEISRERGISVHDATCEVFPLLRLTHEQREMLALEGLYARARDVKNKASLNQSHPVGWGAPHGRRAWEKYAKQLGHAYPDASGASKPLFEFTLTDLAGFAGRMRQIALGYTRRADWAGLAAEALERCGKARVGDLPDEELAKLAAAARDAFGEQT